MAHELAGALQQVGRVRQRCAVKEPYVYVRSEYIDVAKGRISQTCNGTAVMQELPNFVATFSHYLKPTMRDGAQFTCMLFHPLINVGIVLDGPVESQQFRSHRRSGFWLQVNGRTPRNQSLDRPSLNNTQSALFLNTRIDSSMGQARGDILADFHPGRVLDQFSSRVEDQGVTAL
jgi:hypothetical protein